MQHQQPLPSQQQQQHQQQQNAQFTVKDANLHTKAIKSCRWSHDGRYLGTSSTLEKNTKISQLEPAGTVKAIHTIPNSSVIYQVVWHPHDSQHFALTGADKCVEMWDVRAPRASAKIALPCGTNDYASWSPDGRYIGAVCQSGVFTVVDTRAAKCIADLKFATEISEMSWTAGSDHAIFATEGLARNEGGIEIVSFIDEKVQLMDSIFAHAEKCDRLKVDAGYEKMAVGSYEGFVSLWDVGDLVAYHTVEVGEMIEDMAFSGDARYLAVTSRSPFLKIFDTDTAALVARLDLRHPGRALSWHPTENIIAVGLDDKSGAPSYMRLVTFPRGVGAQ